VKAYYHLNRRHEHRETGKKRQPRQQTHPGEQDKHTPEGPSVQLLNDVIYVYLLSRQFGDEPQQ